MKFTTGKIRRNSHKKIAELLEMATSIKARYTTRRIDDAYESGDWEDAPAKAVTDFIADQRRGAYLNIYLTCDEQGQPVELIVDASYWQDEFKITFSPVVEEKHEVEIMEEKGMTLTPEQEEKFNLIQLSKMIDSKKVIKSEDKPRIRAYSPEYNEWLKSEAKPQPKAEEPKPEKKINYHYEFNFMADKLINHDYYGFLTKYNSLPELIQARAKKELSKIGLMAELYTALNLYRDANRGIDEGDHIGTIH